MENILGTTTTLVLNKMWQPVDTKTAQKAIVAMLSCQPGEKYAAFGMDIEYPQNPDGSYNFDAPSYMNPIPWEEWILRPVRQFDLSVRSAKLLVRVPTVILTGCDKMPMKSSRPSKNNIFIRDKGICQYTGEKLSKKNATVDHIIPRDLWKKQGREGSPDRWDNLALAKDVVNFKKGNKTNEEAGLKLIREPSTPAPIPVGALITDAKNRDWNWFMLNKG